MPKNENTYNNWLPKDGYPLTFLVSVTGARSRGVITFSFDQVSNWPGNCMNDDDGEGVKQDLCIYGVGNMFGQVQGGVCKCCGCTHG